MTDTPVHVMLDLETWGLIPGSDIRSIGACVFDPVTGDMPEDATFYTAVENPRGYWGSGRVNGRFFTDSASHRRKYKLERDPDTVDWWNDQSEEAQAAFADSVEPWAALWAFSQWIGRLDGELRLWCNGPHFDEAILAAVYREVGLDVPWSHRAPRDFRTICEAAGGVHLPFEGIEHHALHDAQHQARCVIEAYRRLRCPQGVPRKYEVWQEPLQGTLHGLLHIATFDDADDAMECAYLENCDEPAPDKNEYRRICMRSVFS